MFRTETVSGVVSYALVEDRFVLVARRPARLDRDDDEPADLAVLTFAAPARRAARFVVADVLRAGAKSIFLVMRTPRASATS